MASQGDPRALVNHVEHPQVLASMRALGEEARAPIVGAEGAVVTLADGTSAIDATSQGMAAVLGHRHPQLLAAMRDAVDLPVVSDSGSTTGVRRAAAKRILETACAGEDFAGAVRFCATGSEANDLALALAQALSGSEALVARGEAYYGAVGLAREVTLHPLYHGGVSSTAGGARPVPKRCVRSLPVPAPTAERLSERERAAAEVALEGAAALITDVGSVNRYPGPAYLDELARVARAAGALWVHDEIVTAPGRIGRWFAFQRGEERPDIVTVGKGVTGGAAPGAALILSHRVIELLEGHRWQSVATLWGHPLALAAIDATITIIDEEGLVERAAAAGARLGAGLKELESRHEVVERFTGEGLVWSLVLHGPERFGDSAWNGEGTETAPSDVFVAAALDRGVLVSSYGGLGAWIGPPLISTDEQLDDIVEGFDHALAAVAARSFEVDLTRGPTDR